MNLEVIATDGGRAVSKARILKGLSSRQLAKNAGLSVAAVHKIENGITRAVRPNSAQKICSALELPFDALFCINTPNDDRPTITNNQNN